MPPDWPSRQVLRDLAAVAEATEPSLPIGTGPLLKLEPEGSYLEVLELLEAALGSTPEATARALAILLADALYDQVGPEAGWEEVRTLIMAQPRARRAALARGVNAVLEARSDRDSPRFTRDVCLSEPAKTLIPPLVDLARGLSSPEIESVAMADYGDRHKRHAAALRAVLADPVCRFPAGERWFPAEVVELTGHVPEDATAWRCIALLVLDDVHCQGDYDQMTFRWMRNAEVFLGLPDLFRKPILRGIRHVMESADLWDPYFDQYRDTQKERWAYLPWWDDLSAAA